MKILVLAPQPFFTPRGTPYSVYYRTVAMAEQGTEIDLLTYGEGADVELPGVNHLRLPHPPFLPPVGIGPTASKALLDVVMIGVFVRLLSTRKYDVVHAHEEAVFFAALLKPLFGYRLVYDMHSSLPQQLSNFEFSRSRVLVGVFSLLERLSLRRADVVVTVCPELARYAESVMPHPERQLLIENVQFATVRLAGDAAQGPTAERAGGPLSEGFPVGRRIIFYAGSFEPYQGLDLVVRAFASLRARRDDVSLVLAGGSDDQVEALRKLARNLGVSDDCLLPGSLPQQTVRRLLPEADVLVSSRVHGTNTPLKIYEQLASGVPLVATRILAHTQVLDDEIAFLVDPTPEGLAAGFEAALGDADAARRKAEAALERSRREYSPEAFRRKTAELMERLR